MEQEITLNQINQIPSPTWSWLKINSASLETSVKTAAGPCAEISGRSGGLKMFKTTDASCAEIAALERAMPDMRTISSGAAENLFAAVKPIQFAVVAKTKSDESLTIDFNLKNGMTYAGKQIIIAEENAEITVIFRYNSLPFASGFCGIQTKVWAKPNSKVRVIKVQTLGEKCEHIDDTQFFAEENAEIQFTRIELGAKKSFVNASAVLDGEKSRFKSSAASISGNGQIFDLNYYVIHKAALTDTKITVKSVVGTQAKKTFRGTIDFKNGCKGAAGDEQEDTLLLSPDAVNKSLPVLLCGEEDVSGSHGATLGKLSGEELFYFQSRGIDKDDAEKIMTQAKIMGVANTIPDEETVGKIRAFTGGNV